MHLLPGVKVSPCVAPCCFLLMCDNCISLVQHLVPLDLLCGYETSEMPPSSGYMVKTNAETNHTSIVSASLDFCYSFQNGPCCPRMIIIVARRSPTIGASLSAINRSGDVQQMNFSSWSSSCSFRIAGATPNTTLGNAASTSRAISSVSLKWCQYTIWSFGRLLFMIHKHSFAVLAVPLQ